MNTITVKVLGVGVDSNITINEGESVEVALDKAGVTIAKGLDVELNGQDADLGTPVTADPALVDNDNVDADATVSAATNIDGGC
jgi:hypothetical protein